MAITILKTTNFKNQPIQKIVLPLRKTIDLKVKANGSIVDANNQSIGVLNLGVKGDDSATILRFDLEELYTRGLLKYEINSYTHKLSDYYLPRLYIKTEDEILQFEFDGRYFEIPQNITLNSSISIIYTLRELYRGDEVDNNVNETEDFISSEITGIFESTRFNDYIGDAEVYEELDYEVKSLKKPTIFLNFNEDKKLYVDEISGSSLGYAQDKTITDIHIAGLYGDDKITYTVYFFNEDVNIFIGITANSQDNLWVPREVTQNAGVYTLIVVANTEAGEQLVSNPITMEVIANFLEKKSTNQGAILKTIDGNILYVLAEVSNE